VKVTEIDEQHKKLVSLIDRLNRAIYSDKTKDELKIILSELVQYADEHFSTEEKYFDRFNFEGSDEHKKEHAMFKEKILAITNKIQNNEIEVSFELIDFLEDWLIDHLIEQDQKYVDCFTKHGLS
jgi:hemerythrin-like metal-binding protein